MPDNPNLPENYEDDDVPFKLPKADNDEGTFEQSRNKKRELSDTELRAQDPPLESFKKDRSVDPDAVTGTFEEITSSESVDPEEPTVPYDKDITEDIEIPSEEEVMQMHKNRRYRGPDYNPDEDVPFNLPKSEDLPEDEGRFINKMMTMPNKRSSEPTLAGSGGLDPNPDFARPAEPTMRNQRVHAENTVQHQRPQQQQYPPQGGYIAPPVNPQANQVPQRGALPRKKKRGLNVGCLAIFLGLFVTFCGGMTLISLVVGVVAYARVGDLLNEQIDRLEDYTAFQSTFLYDRNGNELFEVFNEGRRTNVRLNEIPQNVINATIATEDDEFWTNIGIDIPATTVAFLRFVGADAGGADDVAGGSTITQQLVRNVLFDYEYRAERSATRKIEEILLAIALTGRKSKEEIIELYLNEIYYGNLAYGIQAASQIFFGKDASELTLGEAALLAGLPQAPAELDPMNPDPAVQAAVARRWQIVLNAMVEEGYITEDERNQALAQGYTLSSPAVSLKAPHFTVYAQNQLETLLTNLGYSPEQITNGGLQVYTTVDLRIHELAQNAVREQISKLRGSNNVSNGSVVVLKPITGEILAMVGSADYDDDSIDGRVNVAIALRQPGSTVKAFTYAAAMERGMTPGDVIWDTRTRIGIPGQPMYEPRNYDGRFHGPMRMREALANSYNIPAVQTLRHNVGVQYLVDFMRRFGITSLSGDASLYGLSLTLGGGEVALLDLVNGYSVFANEGRLVESQSILCVLDNDDTIIYQYANGCPKGSPNDQTINEVPFTERVLDERIAFIISSILSDNNARSLVMGAASALYTPGINSAVKTGTTNDNKDNWTVGYTRNVAVGVWVGNSRGEPMVGTSGLSGAAPIWNNVITQIYNNANLVNEFAYNGQLFREEFQQPAGVALAQMCEIRSLTDPAQDCRLVNEFLLTSPAGVPDGNGVLQFPPAPPAENQQPPATGPYIVPQGPGVYRTAVVPIAPEIAGSIQFQPINGVVPPPPIYCRVPVELIPTTPGVREQLFIAPPPDAADAAEAENYARSRQLAFLPTIDCNAELASSTPGQPIIITAVVTSPVPGQSVPPEGMPVIGTVDFQPGQIDFYRLMVRSISGGNFPEWTTIGEVHREPVINGQLEFLAGFPGLQPGEWQLKLEVIAPGGALLQPPYIVPFTINQP